MKSENEGSGWRFDAAMPIAIERYIGGPLKEEGLRSFLDGMRDTLERAAGEILLRKGFHLVSYELSFRHGVSRLPFSPVIKGLGLFHENLVERGRQVEVLGRLYDRGLAKFAESYDYISPLDATLSILASDYSQTG